MASSQRTAATLADLGRLAAEVVDWLSPGMLVGLVGPLGAGKTAFAQALARALGVRDTVISPTYMYHQAYSLSVPVRGIERLHHLDLYRLGSDAQRTALDLIPDDPQGVTLIEWIGNVPAVLASADLVITIGVDGTVRQLSFERRQS